MSEEYREYRSRRASRTHTSKKNTGYLKKFLRQTVFSVIIFSIIISPELLGLDSGKYLKNITKSALLYTIDTSSISQIFKDIYSESVHKGEEKNEESEVPSKDL